MSRPVPSDSGLATDVTFRLGNVAVHVTDHINDPGRWQDCCRFFGLDPDDHSTAAVTRFRGLRLPFLPYQVFGIFVMGEMEMFQNGGFLADEMGLGKVGINLTVGPARR